MSSAVGALPFVRYYWHSVTSMEERHANGRVLLADARQPDDHPRGCFEACDCAVRQIVLLDICVPLVTSLDDGVVVAMEGANDFQDSTGVVCCLSLIHI